MMCVIKCGSMIIRSTIAPFLVLDQETGLDELGHCGDNTPAVGHHWTLRVAPTSSATKTPSRLAHLALRVPLLNDVPVFSTLHHHQKVS